jgi:AcrR family transcriptional regulator
MTPATEGATEGRAPGRPRSEVADRDILDAAIHLLGRDGYQALSMAAVAQLAGVGKPTLYRRYASKADLVAAALVHATSRPGTEPPLPRDTRAALRALVGATADALAAPGAMVIVGSLLAQERRDPQLIEAFRARVFHPRHAVVERVLREGIEAGELDPDTPVDVVIDVLFGAVVARAVLGEAVTPAWLDRVVDLALRSAAAVPSDRPGGRP